MKKTIEEFDALMVGSVVPWNELQLKSRCSENGILEKERGRRGGGEEKKGEGGDILRGAQFKTSVRSVGSQQGKLKKNSKVWKK